MGTLGALAGVALPRGAHGQETAQPAMRTLGRTGIQVTVIGIGTFRTTEPPVIRKAIESGVNFLDTARSYHGGNNEAYVGEALRGLRDKVCVATKITIESKEKMAQAIDTSLSKLETDYVDIMLLHHLSSRGEVMNEDARDVLVKARQAGKVKHLGVSTHQEEVEVLDAMIDDPDKLFDVAMVVYNFKSGEAVAQAIERAAKAGIGIVAMKTQAGGYETKELGDISPHQAALKWVLQNPNIATTVPSMVDLAQIAEDTAVMRMDLKLTRADKRVLEHYGLAIAPYYCLRCGACEPTCPHGVDIPAINRCLMYAEGYRDMPNARAAYAELPRHASLAACGDCASCVAQCPNGLTLADQVRRARTLLT